MGLAESHPGHTGPAQPTAGAGESPAGTGESPNAAPCCSQDCTAWEPDAAPAVPPGGKLFPAQQSPCSSSGTPQLLPELIIPSTAGPSGHSPSLLLVTGMLWTVRSLKQDPVSTCSSTELSTKAWRSGRGQKLQRDTASAGHRDWTSPGWDPIGFPCGFWGDQEPQEDLGSPRLTLFLQSLDGLPPLRPLVVGGEQEEVAL